LYSKQDSRLYAPGLELRDTEEVNERLDLLLDSRDYRQCAEVLFLDDAVLQIELGGQNPR